MTQLEVDYCVRAGLVQNFLTSAPLAFGAGSSFPVPVGYWAAPPGFSPLDTSSGPTPSYDNENCLGTLPNIPWGGKITPDREPLCLSYFFLYFLIFLLYILIDLLK